MKSVPQRGSGWVSLRNYDCHMSGCHRTHPLPRGGTDFMGPSHRTMVTYTKVRLTFACILGLCVVGSVAHGLSGPQQQPPAQLAHFHHLHLNTPDPAGALKFYISKFDCEEARFLGKDAVWAQQSWLLFNKVKTPPPWGLTSAIWHFGWGAEDMKAAYQKQLEMGTKFFTPLTDISNILGGNGSGRFFYAYVETPDHGLVELNTSSNHQFGHLHLFSEDPVAAGEWYTRHFGIPRRGTSPASREPRFYRTFQIGPSVSLTMDNVNIIIYPIAYSRKAYAEHWTQGKKGQTAIAPTKGRVVDHIAFSVDNLAETVERLKQEAVKITDPISVTAGGHLKHAFIEGPDFIRIELVEGRASVRTTCGSGWVAC